MTTDFKRRISDIGLNWNKCGAMPPLDRRREVRIGNGFESGRRWSDQVSAKIAFASMVLAMSNAAHATNGTQTLSVNAGGNVYATPVWQVNGSVSSTATYTFTSFGTGTLASAVVSLMVLNPSTLGGDGITLTLPTGCKVGSTAVTSVQFLEAGNTHTTNGAISGYPNYTDGTAVSTQMQFTGVTSTGAVSCTTGGSLAYTY